MRTAPFLALCCLAGACALGPDLPEASPPLADFEEPLDLRAEPDDEAARRALPAGAFAGLVVEDSRDTLAARLGGDAGPLRVAAVVENSPAAAAGLQPDDLLLEARIGTAPPRPLQRPSDWRAIELDQPPGTEIALVVDRAGREAQCRLVLVPRVQPAARTAGERFREELRCGIVVRTATEVEARGAGLPPGAGAVLVGMARSSPWRRTGLAFGDLITHLDGRPLAHPQDLLAALRDPARTAVPLRVVRAGAASEVVAPLGERDGELHDVTIPLLFDYEARRGRTEWSLLLGLLGYESTAAAWRFRVLWLLGFGGGDADRLLEVDR